MSTGGIALLLGSQPHTFRSLRTIGKVVYIFDLVIFITIVALISLRFAREPTSFMRSVKHPTESLLIPTSMLSQSSIIPGMLLYGEPNAGTWLVVVLRILFWTYLALALLLSVVLYTLLFTGRTLTIQSMLPSWLLPIFPLMLCGTMASIIAPHQPPHQSMPICIAGVSAQGTGFLVSLNVDALYLYRLVESGLATPNLRPGLFFKWRAGRVHVSRADRYLECPAFVCTIFRGAPYCT